MQTTRLTGVTPWKTVVVGVALAFPTAVQAQEHVRKTIWTVGGGSTVALSDARARFGF